MFFNASDAKKITLSQAQKRKMLILCSAILAAKFGKMVCKFPSRSNQFSLDNSEKPQKVVPAVPVCGTVGGGGGG